LDKCVLNPGELPIVASIFDPDRGFLISSRRIIWFGKKQVSQIFLSSIAEVSSPVKNVEEKIRRNTLIVHTSTGVAHALTMDPKESFVGIDSLLLNVCIRNKKERLR
jgi:hypothetical protein